MRLHHKLILFATLTAQGITALITANAAALDPKNLITIPGPNPDERFGYSLAADADLNGDGFDDVLVGAPHSGQSALRSGRAYVYFGGTSADAVPDLVLEMETPMPEDHFGFALGTLRDFNGDGYADFFVRGIAPRSHVEIYFGGPELDAIPDLTQSFETLAGCEGIADWNGDGIDDLLTGSPQHPGILTVCTAGSALIFSGGSTPDLVVEAAFRSPEYDCYKERFFGRFLSSAGDLNGDGANDVVIIGYDAYVFFGGQSPPAVLTLTEPVNTPIFPGRVTRLGDWNGDGMDDIAVSSGSIWHVFFGSRLISEIAVRDMVLGGVGEPARGNEDVNGDDHPDVIIGSSRYLEPVRAYVFLGGSFPDSIPDTVLDTGVVSNEVSVGLGDVTGDGLAEAVIGTPGGAGSRGAVAIFELAPPLRFRAFIRGHDHPVVTSESPGSICVRVEPGSPIGATDLDLSTITLTYGSGSIVPETGKTTHEADTDRNGAPEIELCFSRSDLRTLLGNTRGRRTVAAAVEGRLYDRRAFRAYLTLTVLGTGPTTNKVTVSPNPLNPSGALEFHNPTAGRVSLYVFDVSGRRVKTVLDGEMFHEGVHRITLNLQGDPGAPITSGVYFYRLELPARVARGRFIVSK